MPDQQVSLTPSTLLAYTPASTTAVKLDPSGVDPTTVDNTTLPADTVVIDNGVAKDSLPIDPASSADPNLLPADSPLIYQNIASVDKATTIDVTPAQVYTLTSSTPAHMPPSIPSHIVSVQDVSNASAIEGEQVVFTVSLTDTTASPTTVLLTTTNGTAGFDADFSPNLEASFDGGNTWRGVPAGGEIGVGTGIKNFQVRTKSFSDNLVEGSETFALNACANGRSATGTGTIIDKNVAPTIAPKVASVSETSAVEGEQVVFTVNLTDTTTAPTVVGLTTANGTAAFDADFSPNLQASFDGGKTWQGVPAGGEIGVGIGVKSFQVRTISFTDNLVEGNEKFTLKACANGVSAIGTGTIIDKNVAPIAPKVISVSDASATEGATVVFNVGLSDQTTAPTTIQLNLESATATLGEDFAPALEASFDGGRTWTPVSANGQLAVGAGVEGFQVRTQALTDKLLEQTETFSLTATGNGGSAKGIGTILDDGSAEPAYVGSVSNASATEGDKEVFTVNIGYKNYALPLSSYTTPASIRLVLEGATATLGTDFSPNLEASFDFGKTWIAVPSDGLLSVAPGITSFQVRTQALTDSLVEGNETFKLTATNTNSYPRTATGTGTIIDKAPVVPTTVASITDSSVTEGDKEVFTVTLANPSDTITTVKLTPASGTATAGVDFTPDLEVSYNGGTTWTAIKPDGTVDVPGNTPNFLVRHSTVDDKLVEPTEKYTLTAEANGVGKTGTGTILDNDVAPVIPKVIGVTSPSTPEGEKAVFTVGLSETTNVPTTVKLNLASGTATIGDDFAPALEASFDGGKTWTPVVGDSVTLGAGVKDFQVRTQTVDDTKYEGNETFTLTASANGGVVTGTGTIVDNDPKPQPASILSVGNSSVTEGAKEVFTVNLTANNAPTQVKLTLADGTASGGADYAPALEVSLDGGVTYQPVTGDTVTVPGGTASFLVRNATIDDTNFEPTETYTLTAAASGTQAVGTGTILDNDVAPVIPKVIGVTNTSVPEGEKAVFTVGLSETTNVPTTVKLNLASGTATIGDDFAPALEASFDGGKTWNPVVGDSVTLGAGVKEFQVRTQTVDDTKVEPNETFTLTASANGGTVTGTGTIVDNDKPTTVASITDSSVTEGDKEVFTVTLANPGDTVTTVKLTPASGTATAGVDFTPDLEVSYNGGTTWTAIKPDGTVDVPGNTPNFLVRHSTVDDKLVEPTEKYTLTAAANGTQVTGTGTIVDNDKPTTVASITDSTVIEGDKEVFTVTLANPGDTVTTVKLTPASGTATAGVDFTPDLEVSYNGGTTWTAIKPDGTVDVPGNTPNFLVRHSTVDDKLVEPTEKYTLTAEANGVGKTGTGTILDNDKPTTVASITDSTVTEGDKEVFTVTLANLGDTVTTVKLTPASGTATAGVDFTPDLEVSYNGGTTWTAIKPDGTVDVPANTPNFLVRHSTVDDKLVEPTEKYTLTAEANGVAKTGTGTILDNDKPTTVASITDSTVTEGDKEVFTVTLANPGDTVTTVKLTPASGTATAGVDFTPDLEVSYNGGTTWTAIKPDGTVDVPGNTPNFLVRHSTVDDKLVEPTEKYTLTAEANGVAKTGTGTILDNDKPTTVASITDSSVTEGDKEVFTVTLANPGDTVTTVKLTPASGTATAGVDFTPDLEVSYNGGTTWTAIKPDGTVDVPGNTPNFLVRHSTVDDKLVEPTEKYTLTAEANGVGKTGTGTILDNDKPTTVASITDSTVTEGDKEVFTVTLANPGDTVTTVKLTPASGTATAGVDFTPDLEVSYNGGTTWTAIKPDGTVDVPGNTPNFLVRHSTIDDKSVEPTEKYTLTAAANGTQVTGTGTILDNDKPTTVASITDSTVTEGDKEVFTVTLANPGDVPTTVKITPTGGTATPGDDFTPDLEVSYNGGTTWTAIKPDGTVDVPANTPNFLVRHSTVDDKLVEPTEKYTLTVSANGTQATGTGTILDNDVAPAPKVISITDASAVEGLQEVFTVGLSDTTTAPTTVKLTLTSGTATIGDDFAPALEASFDGGKTWTPVAGDTVTLGAGIKDFQVRTLAVDDTLVEGTEKFSLTASGNGGTATGTGTILDNDVAAPVAPKVISISNPTATEGEKEVFTVGLSDTTTEPTTVKLNLASGTATIGKDFAPTLEASFDGGKTWSLVNGDTLEVGVGIKDFQVRTLALTDNLKEGPETFTLTASGNGGTVTGLGTILDNFKKPINAQLVGTDCINEGNKANYCINLDHASDTDRFFTLQVDNGSAKRYDGNGGGQDFVWGGAFDIKSTGKVFKDRVPNDNINGNNNRAAVGPGDASWDFTVYNSQGKVNKGNTITVKVAAGQTKSEQFSVQAWQEKVTIDQDYFNPNGLNKNNYKEGTENFSIKVVDAGDVTVANNNLNVAIKDTSHYTFVSPIALDLNGDGVKTVSIDKGVKFDLLNTGNAVNVGWISSGDGLLAVDNNGNGKIDNRSELFGGGVGEGFAKLASFDSNHDGFVTALDADFGKLKVWQDKNTNGTTDGNELFSLSDLGIASLKVANQSKFELDAQNNVLGERSVATTDAGKSIDMVDVYFQVNPHNLG
jgi:large repetitive protein